MSGAISVVPREQDFLKRPALVCGRQSAPYEPGHSERQVTGSVAAGDARWFATLAVALTGDESVLLSVERDGPLPDGAPAVEEISMVIPQREIEAVLTLLQGVIGHARRVGVIRRLSRLET